MYCNKLRLQPIRIDFVPTSNFLLIFSELSSVLRLSRVSPRFLLPVPSRARPRDSSRLASLRLGFFAPRPGRYPISGVIGRTDRADRTFATSTRSQWKCFDREIPILSPENAARVDRCVCPARRRYLTVSLLVLSLNA